MTCRLLHSEAIKKIEHMSARYAFLNILNKFVANAQLETFFYTDVVLLN